MRHIVYTRHDGGVSVCTPAVECLSWMQCGGLWDDRPRGYMDVQIERQVEAGIDQHSAWRFARAVMFGGCTTAEAFDIIRDRDCGRFGTGFEVWETSEFPRERWFRDAWRRSANGGPLDISMKKARPIHLRHLTAAAERSKAVIQLGRWKDRIRRAETPEDLRRLWPDALRTHA